MPPRGYAIGFIAGGLVFHRSCVFDSENSVTPVTGTTKRQRINTRWQLKWRSERVCHSIFSNNDQRSTSVAAAAAALLEISDAAK